MIVLYNHKTKCDSQVKTEKTKLGGEKTLLPLWRQLAGGLPPCFKHGEVYLHPQGPGVDTSLLLDTRRSFPVQPVLPVCLSILHLKHLFLPTRPLPAYSIHPVWSSVVFVYHSHGCWHVSCVHSNGIGALCPFPFPLVVVVEPVVIVCCCCCIMFGSSAWKMYSNDGGNGRLFDETTNCLALLRLRVRVQDLFSPFLTIWHKMPTELTKQTVTREYAVQNGSYFLIFKTINIHDKLIKYLTAGVLVSHL